tara:strand:- start:136 stop:375 length:240 start_codon:yes stop_codon:yes gene_type:complete
VQLGSGASTFCELATSLVVHWVSALDGVVTTALVRETTMGQCVITLGTPDWDLLDSLRWNLNNSRGTVDGTWDTSIVSA